MSIKEKTKEKRETRVKVVYPEVKRNGEEFEIEETEVLIIIPKEGEGIEKKDEKNEY